MKTNVDYVQKDYYVNESKGTVVCKLLFQIDLDKINSLHALAWDQRVAEYLMSYNPIIDPQWREDNEDTLGVLVFETDGIAYLNPSDTFDEFTGRKIALTRAQSEAFDIARVFYQGLERIYNEVLADVSNLKENSRKSLRICNDHIRDLRKS